MNRQRKWQLRKKRSGCCPQCGQRKPPDSWACDKCRERHNVIRMERYYASKGKSTSRQGATQ